jgi:hypothetical protein
MMNRGKQRPVTLEDLLRLKRTELPPAEFWTQFDRELRAKQLAAIVEKRPWWRSLPSVFSGFSRYQLPLGATAVLAITVLSVREYRHPAVSTEPTVTSVAAAVMPVASSPSPAPAFASGVVAPDGDAGSSTVATSFDPSLSSATVIENSPSLVLASVEASAENSGREPTPTARFIAANLALVKATEPGVVESMLGGARGFEARGVPTRSRAVDPLAQMISPSDARRSRLLAASAVAAVSMNNAQPARTTEIRSRRLSDEQLYDTVSRFGAKGNSLLVKF